MRRRLIVVGLTVALCLAAGLAGAAIRSKPELKQPRVIRTLEVGGFDELTDVGAQGFSRGDMEIIRHQLWNHAQTKRLGFVQVVCHIISVARPSLECSASMNLREGIVTVAGPFFGDRTDNVWAVTGGTGAFRNARGYMELPPAPNGLLFHDLFLEP
jgi:hypothetical protein